MKTKKLHDEREIQLSRKIQSDLCQILMLVLLASVLIQQFILNAPLSQYLVELVCLIMASFYLIIRNIMAGNDIYQGKNPKKFSITNVLVASCSATLVIAILNYTQYKELYTGILDFHFLGVIAVFFISMTLISAIIYYIMYKINAKKQQQIQHELDDQE